VLFRSVSLMGSMPLQPTEMPPAVDKDKLRVKSQSFCSVQHQRSSQSIVAGVEVDDSDAPPPLLTASPSLCALKDRIKSLRLSKTEQEMAAAAALAASESHHSPTTPTTATTRATATATATAAEGQAQSRTTAHRLGAKSLEASEAFYRSGGPRPTNYVDPGSGSTTPTSRARTADSDSTRGPERLVTGSESKAQLQAPSQGQAQGQIRVRNRSRSPMHAKTHWSTNSAAKTPGSDSRTHTPTQSPRQISRGESECSGFVLKSDSSAHKDNYSYNYSRLEAPLTPLDPESGVEFLATLEGRMRALHSMIEDMKVRRGRLGVAV